MCLAIAGFFAVGTFWVWRGVSKDQKIERSKDQVTIVINEDQKNPKSKEQTTENNDLSIFQSSSLQAVNTTTTQSTTTLPNTFNLAVPFTSQAPEKNWSQPWQDACEEAALLMLDAYYKNYGLSTIMARDEILKMVAWENQKGWGMSIVIEDIALLAKDYFKLNVVSVKDKETGKLSPPQRDPVLMAGRNLEIKVIENPTVDEIKKFIVAGNPVLVVADGKTLNNPHFKNGGPVYHSLIIKGYTETKFITNDPGTQFGADFTYTYDNLMSSIHDWNGGDVKNGRQVILVIE